MTGLIDRDLFYIQKALEKYPEIEKGIIYGSRALGNYKRGSDVDLAIVGEPVSHRTMVGLNDDLNEVYPLPYMFDLVHYDELSNEDLKNHIDQYGKELYSKGVSHETKR
ncbi:nucleotidyltransferase domain-containing protein [Salicibibacter cibarius]|uniref:Nucleotidyltransferase domain-containing protein n=1 Tax=Salicibibacter cibarius TaxID=2743000 RepID=A0A7T6YZK7_9BACI|nr:nucleotidyltransferase domain-containing protein [Salicibibacter cibarius]QQK74235.1 nucleotidyltransferase domain-containing protein [Salicibibacter cibarius]